MPTATKKKLANGAAEIRRAEKAASKQPTPTPEPVTPAVVEPTAEVKPTEKVELSERDQVINKTIRRWGVDYCEKVRALLGNDEDRFREHVAICALQPAVK